VAELASAREELSALEQCLQAGEFARDEQEEMGRLAAELDALGYDSEAHQRARAEAAGLAGFEGRYQQLQLAGQQADAERSALEELRVREQRWTETLAGERERRDALAAEVAGLPGLTEQIRAKASELEERRRQSHEAQLELGAARQMVAHVEEMAEERIRVVARRDKLVEERAELEELRLAFGKRGIQAMIIEAAIPEIEIEANRLLARMTEGRMNVRMETQRLTQKGDIQETLEITISDELGTRAYETYSGGETFRVNFAIRIALSKLLARRSGAQLQLLVIDEGFGTQDAEGRERLVEAITSIQEDFARILVITHIEELKDAFPVRIEVTKTERGSHFRLS
jgi:exonuclease SbcC